MSKERSRSIKSAQLKMRELNFAISGTAGTPVASGFDRFGIKQVIDLGVGNYTVIFKAPFERACLLGGWSSSTADVALQVTALAYDRITVQCTLASTAAAVDADISLCVKGSDARFDQ